MEQVLRSAFVFSPAENMGERISNNGLDSRRLRRGKQNILSNIETKQNLVKFTFPTKISL